MAAINTEKLKKYLLPSEALCTFKTENTFSFVCLTFSDIQVSVGGDGTASISITTPEGVLAICVGCTGNSNIIS
jgi:hypothetical protein